MTRRRRDASSIGSRGATMTAWAHAFRSADVPPRQKRTGRIAVLDDDQSVRTALWRLLRACGIESDLYATYGEFLDAIRTERPDCLILDFHMPDTDGLFVIRGLKDLSIELPVIVISGSEELPEAEFSLSGVASILRKPLTEAQLLKAIEDARGQNVLV